MSTPRSEHPSPLGYASFSAGQPRSGSPSASNSPVDPSLSSARPPPFTSFPSGISSPGIMVGNARSGAGSPSHDMSASSRLFFKRAREIQAQEGVPLNLWGGPPTSGNSTPLRENIPESPTDGFPDFAVPPTPDSLPQARRARAGTVPSRFSPGGPGNGVIGAAGLAAKSARFTPSQSPFAKSPSPNVEAPENRSYNSALFSRLRAGSMPQRSQFAAAPGTNSPFGPSIFSSWNPTSSTRDRGSTLASIASVSSNGPSSPAQSQFSKEGLGESDGHMRTLDYLGLAETPQPSQAQIATPYNSNMRYARQLPSRFRSYSVNNKDKYDDEEDGQDGGMQHGNQYVAALQGQLAATNAAIHNHNLAVQAFANQASSTRPRAHTAGVLDTPGSRLTGTYFSNNVGLPNSIAPIEARSQDSEKYEELPQAIANMGLGRSNSYNAGLLGTDEQGSEGPTSALWLGSIPTSTTTSTLTELFKHFGRISSARVLTNKSCGFVNFERVENAISAKASMNGKEIFPGAGPIRINFAKPVSASNTPGHEGLFPSPSPDPYAHSQDVSQGPATAVASEVAPSSAASNVAPAALPLHEIKSDVVATVTPFGGTEADALDVSQKLQSAIEYTAFIDEIPQTREPSHTRAHDAPKLRDIRKRIDNQSISQAEIEAIALDMLPEIAELASDYLGNTVVQKLFEHCSDQYRDAMLAEIAPHMAEIGGHKNGTWAAQKIIDVCKTPSQMSLIVEHLRPYTLPLFLDQYGNYVLQGCLKFGPPYDDFIFETMVSRMGDIAQGRYGARAMRACLESHHASKNQQRLLAGVIAMQSVQLAANANGALLLTWFLDTCAFPHRRTVLAPRLVPYLVHLCTHKVAYLTVLKVINQKSEPDARDTVLRSMFYTPNDQVLEAILRDQTCGATLIFKVLTTPFFDEGIRGSVVEVIKTVLGNIKAQPSQGYKRLMDEVGLTRAAGTSRDASTHSEQRQRPTSRHANTNGQHGQPGQSPYSNKGFYNPVPPNAPNYDMAYGAPRGEVADANSQPFPPFNQGMNPGMMYNTPNSPMPPAMTLEQLQFQQNMMSRGGPPMNYNYAAMQNGYGGYNQVTPSADLRPQNMSNGSPVQPPTPHMPQMPGGQPAFVPPGYGMNMAGYGYPNVGGGMPNMGYMQQEQSNSRRNRR